MIRDARICVNCLNGERNSCPCDKNSPKSFCKRCPKPHNDLLHDENFKPKPRNPQASVSVSAVQVSSVSTKRTVTRRVPVKPTAAVKIYGANGYVEVRAALDTQSDAAMITEKVVNQLGLLIKPAYVQVTTYSGDRGAKVLGEVDVKLTPHFDSGFELNFPALVHKKLMGKVPQESIEFENHPSLYDKLVLADYECDTAAEIDLLIGTKDLGKIWKEGMIRINPDLVLQNTELGYMVIGSGILKVTSCAFANVNQNQENEISVKEFLKFFEYELAPEEKQDFLEQLFKSTVKLNKEGFIVNIPWREDRSLGESQKITMARTKKTVERMSEKTFDGYIAQIDEFEKNGWMRKADESKPAKNFIPIFTLEKASSLSTPVRLLFSCDQKTSNKKSVNDIQHAGPKLQNDLRVCLVKFRFKRVALVGDISKMYLRIKVNDADVPYQRTFIMRSKDGPLEEVELPTLIFGSRSAPYLALRVIKYIAEIVEKTDPSIAKMINENFFVDDVLVSFDSIEEARKALSKLIEYLAMGNFPLKKIASSHLEVVRDIPKENTLESISKELNGDGIAEQVGLLGIIWNRGSDVLQYKVDVQDPQEPITKRKAVSIASKIYDPTGCLAPALLPAKLLIQKMWEKELEKGVPTTIKMSWDSPIEPEIAEAFKKWQRELKLLKEIKIQRFLLHDPKNKEEILLGFSDASLKAYGCVAYYRVVDSRDKVHITIIGARARVTPLSKSFVPENKDHLTLARLELMGAVMLSNYVAELKLALESESPMKIMLFSDSKITLAWIQGDESRWNTFVSNRVKIIQKETRVEDWHYVNTKMNPADLASRGVEPSVMINSPESQLWFNGPEFIHCRNITTDDTTFSTMVDEKKGRQRCSYQHHK